MDNREGQEKSTPQPSEYLARIEFEKWAVRNTGTHMGWSIWLASWEAACEVHAKRVRNETIREAIAICIDQGGYGHDASQVISRVIDEISKMGTENA